MTDLRNNCGVESFLAGGGEMAARIAAHDWSATLGSTTSWPQSLKTTVGFMIHSPVPIVLLWGADGIMIYNDAYSVFAGGRHPRLLGSKVREGWPEVADFNDHVMKVGLSGGTLSYKDQELTLHRSGKPESVWMNLDYSPVIDESGQSGGVIAIVVETTERVINARNLAESERRLQTALSAGRGIGTWDWDVPQDRVVADDRFARLYGVDPERARAGAPIAEFFAGMHPDDRERVMAEVAHAVKTGERFNSVYRLSQADGSVRWAEAEGQCTLDAQGRPLRFPGATFDVTERIKDRNRRAALVELGDRIRDIDDPDALAYVAAEILGRTLDVSRAGYGTIDTKAETITISRDWNAPGIKSLAGVLNFRDYGSYIEELKWGKTVICVDADSDPRTAARAGALKAISAQAFVNMPVTEQGGFVALLYLNHATARKWPPEEIGFIREVAERTRTAVERRRAEAELRANEAQLRFLDALGREIAKDLDADAILATTTRMLGRHLGVVICAYADMDADQDGFTIRGDWSAPGLPSIVGHYHLADFGKRAVEKLGAGLPLILNDIPAELPPEDAAAFQSLGVAATACMPLVKEGRLTALMAVHDSRPRVWSANDLALLTEVTERSWAHIERVRALAGQKSSEAQFGTMAQAMPNHVWAARPDGMLDWFNQQVYAYSGAAPGTLDGAAWTGMVHPKDLPAAAAEWSKSLASGEIYEIEFRLRRADGTYRWHLARALPIKNEAGQVTRWIGTNTDIHDQKTVSEALTEESKALDLLNRSASSVAAELDLDRVVQMVVDTGVALTGAQFGAFFYNVLDAQGESYTLFALAGVERSHFDKFPMPRNTEVFGPTFRGEGIVRSGDITQDPRYGKNGPHKGMPEGHLPVRSYLAVPVIARSAEVIGGLFFGHARTQMFDARSERLISGLAAHAAIGIDNARLFQALQRLNQTLEERVAERTAELAHSEGQLRSIVETTHIYQTLLDLEGRVQNANATALAGIDAQAQDVIGRYFWETPWFTGTPEMPRFVRESVATVKQGHSVRREILLKLPTGERWFDFAMRPLLDEKDQVTALVPEAADITERRLAEDALRQAQKMEAVGQLTGGIAHDFNNLLQGITGALDRVQHRLAQGRTGDVERFLKAAIESANRAASLTHRLLAFSRRQTLDPRPTDANRLIGGMEELVRRTMGPNVAVEVVGAGGLWPIRVDPSQLENSLLNLCINARDAMPNGGTLTIETANKWLDERGARDREIPAGQYVSLCVTDNGTGMTQEVIARAFDPFFTTKPLGQGTGLGLSMIYGFVRQSGGQVRVYSEIGKGTTMCLYFPRHAGAAQSEDVPGSEIVERGFGETVLVVDDEPTVRMLVAEVLSESYYNIAEAADGPSALKILESDRRIDLMITDVGLPGGMNGRQVADAARVLRKDLKVLFITGYAENAAVGNGHLDAGMEILAKPFAMSTLANKVREMIER